MENKGSSIKKWNIHKNIDWGPAKVTFYIKNDDLLVGLLRLPGKTEGLIDEGHKNGEYLCCLKGYFTMVLYQNNGEKEKIEVKENDWLFIPENLEHQIINNSDEEIITNFILIV